MVVSSTIVAIVDLDHNSMPIIISSGRWCVRGPGTDRRASRTRVVLGDIAVASASGCAGVLALTTGVSAALALLLPLVTFGLLLGGGQPGLAMSALALLLMNLVCMNLADVTTFLVQHIPPSTWRRRDRAAQQISRNAKPAV